MLDGFGSYFAKVNTDERQFYACLTVKLAVGSLLYKCLEKGWAIHFSRRIFKSEDITPLLLEVPN